MDELINIIAAIFRACFKAFRDYLTELKSKFLIICVLFFLLFLLLKFTPRFENIVFENIPLNTVLALWMILVHTSLYIRFLVFLPISVRTYEIINNAFLKIRSFASQASLTLSCWLSFQGIFSLFSEQFLYKKFFAALLLQALFVPFFLKMPKSEDVEDFRWFRRYEMSKWKKVVYPFWSVLVLLLLLLLPIFLVGDIYTLPNFQIKPEKQENHSKVS